MLSPRLDWQVVELAPSLHLPPATREAVLRDAVRLCSEAKYENAGTVEFLVDRDGRHYFMEVRTVFYWSTKP